MSTARRIHFGIGGAGNTTSTTTAPSFAQSNPLSSSPTETQKTHQKPHSSHHHHHRHHQHQRHQSSTTRRYSTGIGGFANHDSSEAQPLFSHGGDELEREGRRYSTGIGGFANFTPSTTSGIRMSLAATIENDRRHDDDNVRDEEDVKGRRGSLAASVFEFLGKDRRPK